MNRLEGESWDIPNLKLNIEESLLSSIKEALITLDRSYKFGPYQLIDTHLSISPYDISKLLGYLNRTPKNELPIYRFRKVITDLLNRRVRQCKNKLKINTYQNLINHTENSHPTPTSEAPSKYLPKRIDLYE